MVKLKYAKASLIQCTCCGMMRHQNELEFFGELPTVYVCYKCLGIDIDKVRGRVDVKEKKRFEC